MAEALYNEQKRERGCGYAARYRENVAGADRAVVDTIDDVTDELMSVSIMEIPQEQWDYKINKIDRVDKDAVLYIPKGKTRDEW